MSLNWQIYNCCELIATISSNQIPIVGHWLTVGGFWFTTPANESQRFLIEDVEFIADGERHYKVTVRTEKVCRQFGVEAPQYRER